MATGKSIWGIDLGQAALKALKLRMAGDKAEVVAFDFIEHSKMLSQPDADREALIAEALEKFSSRHQLANEQLVVSVPGQQTLARFTKLPPVEPKKIPDIVRYEAEQQIPFDMDEVVWDYQAFTEEDSPDVEVGIFAMKRELIHEYMSHYTALNMETTIVQSAPLALYNALAFEGRCGDEAVVILDIGAQNTDLVVAAGPSLWTRTINIGGNQFTETLVKAFKLSFQKAEALKRTASSSKYARQIFQAMRPVFADLVAEIQRSIGFYSSSHRDVKLTKVFGTGNAFKMPGLQKFLQQSLSMDVIRLNEFQKLTPPSEGAIDEFKENTLTFGVAYGLALQGLGEGKIESNLLPPEIARQTAWGKKHTWFIGAAALLLLACGVVWFRFMLDKNALDNAGSTQPTPPLNYAQARAVFDGRLREELPSRDFAYEWLRVAEAFKGEFNKQKNERETYEKRVNAYLRILNGKSLWLQVLNEILTALPGEPTLDQAQSPDEYRALIASRGRALERSKRKEIFIESLKSIYSNSVYSALDSIQERQARQMGRQVTAEPSGSKRGRGFVIQLRVRTPNEDGATFVESALKSALERVDWPENYDFFFDGIRIASAVTNKDAAASSRSTGIRPGLTRMETDSTEEFVDPLTGESTADDWTCEIYMAVVLGDRDKMKGGSGAAEPDDSGDGGDAMADEPPPPAEQPQGNVEERR